ncbi:MAG TPA: COQ9 family protein [Caulobacteraceae bacterium]|jgi:ubiquinone biosynthesis protein COQ9|nr:COQ9 family protein [Caulobacteraceae bacterium]
MSHITDWAERTEAAVLDAALRRASREGWSWRLVYEAAGAAGLSRPEVELLLPDGPRDLAALLSRRLNAEALADLDAVDPASLKVRERIREAVTSWLRGASLHETAVRRWAGFLALPMNTPLGLRLAWESADALWRWAGDTAADENHYTKRVLLAEILISSLAIAISAGEAAALVHLDRRIAGVMRFEKMKAGVKPLEAVERLARRLGSLRYRPAAPSPEQREGQALGDAP